MLQGLLKKHVRKTMQLLDCADWDVSIWLTTDQSVRKLNAQYRGVDASTDVLSFALQEVRRRWPRAA